MVRSMYAGVSGMKSHQTRMDAIGNNISNVNTYGFKSSRATFRDSYYQAIRGAAAATGSKGGMNPSEIGYGAQISSVDVLHSQSTLSNTGYAMDCAITGEGYFQVQDADGNIYYTRAGMLDFDSNGNLVDSNGNFVLGVSGSPLGKGADTQKIQVNLPAVNPAASSATEPINDISYTIKASKNTEDGNVLFTWMADSTLPDGLPCKAELTNSGVTIRLNAKAKFMTMDEVQDAVNQAIQKANDGKEHPAGTFTITADPDIDQTKFGTKGLTGEEIVGANFGIKQGSVPTKGTAGTSTDVIDAFGMTFDSTELKFSGTGSTVAYDLKYTPAAGTKGGFFEVSAKIGTTTWKGEIPLSSIMKGSGSVLLKNGTSDEDAFTLNYPTLTSLLNKKKLPTGNLPDLSGDEAAVDAAIKGMTGLSWDTVTTSEQASAAEQSRDLGLGSKGFSLKGGTEGGPQTVKDLEGISIGADGVILASHGILGKIEIGRIDLAIFNNAAGLIQSGNTYFTPSANSGDPELSKPGMSGAGELKSSALEQSNVDLSQEFSDMIVTQRGFQANSRLITVSDTMLEELINLKR